MTGQRGSVWRKWDLHVHTPASIIQHYGGDNEETWAKYIQALAELPPEIKVLGINDYIFIDGYKKVLEAKQAGRLPNIDLLLCVIELRLDKFGGTENKLRRANFHVIFSDEISAETIQSQFVSRLHAKYTLAPGLDDWQEAGKWDAAPTKESIIDLGRYIIESAPQEKRADFGTPAEEGFNNICFSLRDIQELTEGSYLKGKVITAIGKAEWAAIKWTNQSIAEKKTMINDPYLVFTASETVEDWKAAHKSLLEGKVNYRLLDCSDAHYFAESGNKDRLGNCYTWIKADPTFEGLRQAVFQYSDRVHVGERPPSEPMFQIKKVEFNFGDATILHSKEAGYNDAFCFRGRHELYFSPYLTCIIGGRGSGKSTLLSLINEKIEPGSAALFKSNTLSPATESVSDCVSMEPVVEKGMVEFLQQNEVEQFASDHKKMTAAIFARLRMRDTNDALRNAEGRLQEAIDKTRKQIESRKKYSAALSAIEDAKRGIAKQQTIVGSFADAEYLRLNGLLAEASAEMQSLQTSKNRLDTLLRNLSNAVEPLRSAMSDEFKNLNAYDKEVRSIVQQLLQRIVAVESDPDLASAAARKQQLNSDIDGLRSELETFLRERGLSEESLADAGKAPERFAQLEGELQNQRSVCDTLKLELDGFRSMREAATDYASKVHQLLDEVNRRLQGEGSELKPIKLEYTFDVPAFKEVMVEYVTREATPPGGRKLLRQHVEEKLRLVDFDELKTPDSVLRLLDREQGVTGDALREFFGNDLQFEILKLEADIRVMDAQNCWKMSILYDGKPVENSSFGQRCTAVIVALLSLGNLPIVIDEPEAHLDSLLIAKYLVELVKNQKIQRQMIFATHNANFVVNGDADLIHCLSMDDDKVTSVKSTTIEDLKHRELLLKLEGGAEAFRHREKRYGLIKRS